MSQNSHPGTDHANVCCTHSEELKSTFTEIKRAKSDARVMKNDRTRKFSHIVGQFSTSGR